MGRQGVAKQGGAHSFFIQGEIQCAGWGGGGVCIPAGWRAEPGSNNGEGDAFSLARRRRP